MMAAILCKASTLRQRFVIRAREHTSIIAALRR
jgi:hypothetical protein